MKIVYVNPKLFAELFAYFFHLSKLQLLTQFPASNEEKNYIFEKTRHLQYWVVGLTEHLPNIMLNSVVFLLN